MAGAEQTLWVERVLGIKVGSPQPDKGSDEFATALTRAGKEWRDCRLDLQNRVAKVKHAALDAYADEPEVAEELRSQLDTLDAIFDVLDDRLATAFERGADPRARQTMATEARSLLAQYIKFIASDPLIAGLDDNPFGLDVGLRQTASKTLSSLAAVAKTMN